MLLFHSDMHYTLWSPKFLKASSPAIESPCDKKSPAHNPQVEKFVFFSTRARQDLCC